MKVAESLPTTWDGRNPVKIGPFKEQLLSALESKVPEAAVTVFVHRGESVSAILKRGYACRLFFRLLKDILACFSLEICQDFQASGLLATSRWRNLLT